MRTMILEADDLDEQGMEKAVGKKNPCQQHWRPEIKHKHINFEKPLKSILLKKKDQGKSILKKFPAGVPHVPEDGDDDLWVDFELPATQDSTEEELFQEPAPWRKGSLNFAMGGHPHQRRRRRSSSSRGSTQRCRS